MKGKHGSALWLAGLILASTVPGCGGGGSDAPPPPPPPLVTVVVEPGTVIVPPGTATALTATVRVASVQGGPVTWTISPTSGAGTLSDVTGTSVTFNAPTDPPASNTTVTITATSIDDHAKFASAVITVPATWVTIDPPGAAVTAGGMQAFTATVHTRSPEKGVTWSISPTTGAGTLSDVTSTSVTYNAPATPPTTDLSVTVTATALADPGAPGSASIYVPAIVVTALPASVLLPLRATQRFTAAVDNDPGKAGVNWSLFQGTAACAVACGALAMVDATTVDYTGPAVAPPDPRVTLRATSVTDATKFAAASIALTTGSVQLTPDQMNFSAKTGHSRSADSVLTNTGSAALDVSGIAVDSTVYTQTNTCGTSLAAGASCAITVTFKPARFGTFDATLSVTDSSLDSPQLIKLHGQGLPGLDIAAARIALAVSAKVSAPRPTGASEVGTRTVVLVDSTRSDPYLSRGSNRELPVRFWYPMPAGKNCRRAEYTAPAVWKYSAELMGVRLPEVSTNSCQDALVADGAYPVVVFTHGYTGTFTDYTFLFEELASRGYVVASVNHTYEATATALPGGRLAKSVFGSHLKPGLRIDKQAISFAVSARLADLKFVVDQLDRLNRSPAGPFANHLDTARMAIAGHSLGGLTALEALQRDERLRAAVSLDGVIPERAIGPISKPVLLIDAGRELWSDDERRLWSQLRGPRYAVNLKRAAHAAPSDAVWLARGAVKTGHMRPEQAVAATRDFVAAFLDNQLQGKLIDGLLKGPSIRYPEAELTSPSR